MIVRDCHGVGVVIGNGMQILGGRLHHNGHMNVGSGNLPDHYIDGCIIDGTEIDHANVAGVNFFWEGGNKFKYTRNLIVRNCPVHDNNGPGLWTDINNDGTIFDDNHCYNNQGPGIFHEISYSGRFRRNTCHDNSLGFIGGWLWNCNILIAAAGGNTLTIYPDLLIEDNMLSAAETMIGLIQQARGSGNLGPWLVRNVKCRRNVMTLASGQRLGGVTDNGDLLIFSGGGNDWQDNVYNNLSGVVGPWWWNNGTHSQAGWQGFGFDLAGVFNP